MRRRKALFFFMRGLLLPPRRPAARGRLFRRFAGAFRGSLFLFSGLRRRGGFFRRFWGGFRQRCLLRRGFRRILMLVAVTVVGAFGIGYADITILFIGILEKGQGRIGRGRLSERQLAVDILCVRYRDAAGKGAVVDFEQRRLDDVFPRTFFAGDGMRFAVVIDECVHIAF